jgi:hypothetical protein
MASIQNVSAEALARLFHHYQEALADDSHHLATRESSSCWEHAPQSERKLMVAAARLTLLELVMTSQEEPSQRKYFAKPGDADWGC